MRPQRLLPAALLAAILCLPALAAAQNREHQQLFADLRMLHEQAQKIQLALNTLTLELKATNTRLDQQDAATRKEFADQQYRMGLVDETLGTLRERLNDNTVRVGQLMQEMDSVRQGIEVLQTLLNQILVRLTPAPVVDPETGLEVPVSGAPPVFTAPPPSTAGAGSGATGAAPPPVTSPIIRSGPPPPDPATAVMPPSSTVSYKYAFGLYTSGDHTLAIEAFKDFVMRFPTAADAPRAQYFMGESLYQLGRYKEAIAAYDGVILGFPQAELVPDAYFKQGVCYQSLRMNVDARRVYQLILDKFPESTAAINAATSLKGMGGGERPNSE
jgi:tol-pal system protein YbgF